MTFLLMMLGACGSGPLPPPYTVAEVTQTLQAAGYTVDDLGDDPVGRGPMLSAFSNRRCLRATRDGRFDDLCVWTCTTPSCDEVDDGRRILGESYGVFEAEGSFLIHRVCADDASVSGFDCTRVRADLSLGSR